jgi:hypothetical protein
VGDKDWQLDISEKIGEIRADTKALLKAVDDHLKDPYAHEQTRERSWKNLIPVIALLVSMASIAISASRSASSHERNTPSQADSR